MHHISIQLMQKYRAPQVVEHFVDNTSIQGEEPAEVISILLQGHINHGTNG